MLKFYNLQQISLKNYQSLIIYQPSFDYIINLKKYTVNHFSHGFTSVYEEECFLLFPIRVFGYYLLFFENFQNVSQVKSSIKAIRYQILYHSRWSIYIFCTWKKNPLVHRTYWTFPVFPFLCFQILSCVYYDWILSIG